MVSIQELLISDNDFMIESEILTREFQLDIDRLNDAYIFETELCIVDGFYTESEEDVETKESKGFFAFVSGLIQRLIRLITDFFTMIKESILGPSKNLTAEEYFEDPGVKVKLDHDIEEMQRVADEELLKGRKFVQAIAKKTNIDDQVIADWVDSSSQKLSKVKGVVMTAGVLFGTRFMY